MAQTYNLNASAPLQTAVALLSPGTSWAQRRADADRNLLLQSAITQTEQQQEQLARQQAMLVQQQEQALYDRPFLEADKARWKAQADGFKEKIRQRVERQYGGDYERYAKSTLEQDMQYLIQDSLKSPLYQRAQQNRLNFARMLADQQDGKMGRLVQWRTADGKTKTGLPTQAYADFENGLTEALPYNGGFKVSGKWRDVFEKSYAPTAPNRYTPVRATPAEIVSAITATEGLSPEDAQQYARQAAPLLGNVYYKFDAIDPLRVRALELQARSVRTGERNAATNAERLKLQKSVAGAISPLDIALSPQNKLKTEDGTPVTIPTTYVEGGTKPVGVGSLQVYDGSGVNPYILKSMGGQVVKNEKTGQGYLKGVRGGKGFLMAPNNNGGVDLRPIDLSGISYDAIQIGNIYRDTSAPVSASDKVTGEQPFLIETIVDVPAGKERDITKAKWYQASGGLLDTPLGRGAAEFMVNERGEEVIRMKYLQKVRLTAEQRRSLNQANQSVFGKTGQVMMGESLSGTPDLGGMVMDFNDDN